MCEHAPVITKVATVICRKCGDMRHFNEWVPRIRFIAESPTVQSQGTGIA